MSHQRYPSIDPLKEPHSVSLKVLRLSRPSLVTQHPLPAPALSNQDQNATTTTQPMPASLAYNGHSHSNGNESDTTNPAPFLLTPILNLPPSFGSAYVGETFSCTLCANHDVPDAPTPTQQQQQQDQLQTAAAPRRSKYIRDVRIEAEMKTPGSGSAVQKLVLGPRKHSDSNSNDDDLHHHDQDEDKANKEEETETETDKGTDLEPGQTLQRIVSFDLKEEGNHVLAVTVSYYEATETSGRTRTFRKLYQFICKGSLIVRTKVSSLPRLLVPPAPSRERGKKKKRAKGEGEGEEGTAKRTLRSWAMEAQLENCSEDIMQLERVGLDLEPGLRYVDCNWEINSGGGRGARKPVLHPGEIEQCCFVVLEDDNAGGEGEELAETEDGRILFGVLGIGWRSEMGNKGFLSTGKLGTRVAR